MDTKYLKRVGIYVLCALFSVGMLFYIGYHLYNGFTSHIATEGAKETSRSFTVRADAYIFREEEVLSRTSSGGELFSRTENGSHVARGDEVAKIYADPDPAAQASVNSLKDQLELLEDYAAASHGAKDAAKIDLRIYDVLTRMKGLVRENDYNGVWEMRSELIAEMNERAIAAGSGEDSFDALIASVESQLQAERAKLGNALESVYAHRSGWYYDEADGYEGIFTAEALETLTLASFDSVTSAAPSEIGSTAGKIVTDHLWYIAVSVDAEHSAGMTPGADYTVSFAYNGGKELSMNLEKIVTEHGSDRAVLVFSSGEIHKDFSFARRQTVDITVKVITGFSVPRSAVRLDPDTGLTGVYVFDGVRAHFRQIEIIKTFDDICIVTAVREEEDGDVPYLEQNDLIITEGKALYDGKIIA